jgi:hypothetical protein
MKIENFVIDAVTLDQIFSDPKNNFLIAKISDALQQGRAKVTSLTMQQLKENCPLAYQQLKQLNVSPIRRDKLVKLAKPMIELAHQNGVNIKMEALRSKIFVLALARSEGCCVLSIDFKSTEISTDTLAILFGVNIASLDQLWD